MTDKTQWLFILGSGMIFSLGTATGYAVRAKEVPPVSVVEQQADVTCLNPRQMKLCSEAMQVAVDVGALRLVSEESSIP